jgi:DNA-binding CsgD family transcriptional regulator
MNSLDLREAIATFQHLRSVPEFAAAIERALVQVGCPQYSYVSMNVEKVREGALRDVEPEMIHITNRPDWGARYVEEDYGKVDPVVRECFGGRLPIRWTESFMANNRTLEEVHMMSDAWENGIRAGYTIPIHGPNHELGLLMLSCGEAESDFLRMIDAHQYDLQIMAYHFHDSINRSVRMRSDAPCPIPLTEREVEILKWTVDGKTAWEIGQILNISERTVNFHLRNIMGKFGVHNKTHAAAKAVSFGLIPGFA